MAHSTPRFSGGRVSSAIWESELRANGTTKTVLKASVSRRCKERDGNWKSSQSLGRDEVPLAAWCLKEALARIIEEETAQDGNGWSTVDEEAVMYAGPVACR